MADGIRKYTVTESQNIVLGQSGAAFVDTTGQYTPPSGTKIVAMTMLTDMEFAELTPVSTDYHYGTTLQHLVQVVILLLVVTLFQKALRYMVDGVRALYRLVAIW